MSKEKHGLIGGTLKIIMVIVFTLIGALTLAGGAWAYAQQPNPKENWLAICNIVFGCLLLTSPFFMSGKRKGIFKILKWLMGILFTLIGVVVLIGGAYSFSQQPNPKENWLAIVNIVYGCLLLTSPLILKKSLTDSKE